MRFVDEAFQYHAAWLHLRVFEQNDGYTVQLVDYAYESVAGASILAGEVPEPSAAYLLGLMFLACLPRRRRWIRAS